MSILKFNAFLASDCYSFPKIICCLFNAFLTTDTMSPSPQKDLNATDYSWRLRQSGPVPISSVEDRRVICRSCAELKASTSLTQYLNFYGKQMCISTSLSIDRLVYVLWLHPFMWWILGTYVSSTNCNLRAGKGVRKDSVLSDRNLNLPWSYEATACSWSLSHFTKPFG